MIDVLSEAKRKREASPELFHSDQGSEYASAECLEWLITHGIKPSHSPKGKPRHNGRQESFVSAFTFEFGKTQHFPTIEKLIEAIGRHMHYYNTERIHSALKMPPQKFFLKATRQEKVA